MWVSRILGTVKMKFKIFKACYMNVMLQSVFYVKEFRKLILDLIIEEETEDKGKIMILRLQQLFALMMGGNRKYINPLEFFESMAAYKPSKSSYIYINKKIQCLLRASRMIIMNYG